MLDHLLQRYSDNAESTLGLLMRREATALRFLGYTLEDEARAVKVQGETRIPAGIYDLALRKVVSPLTLAYRKRFPDWFSWHVQIMAVPGFAYCYLHIGNDDDDTDACVLMGDSTNNNQNGKGFIGESAKCYTRWYKDIVPRLEAGQRARIEIRDEHRLR